MTDFKRRLAAAIATGALVASTFAPGLAYADTNLTISGNGEQSQNGIVSTNTQTTTVVQNNTANVTNDVHADGSTGGNVASGNTGGSTAISTGKADVTVAIQNLLNKNTATAACCGAAQTTNVNVTNNGEKTYNTVGLAQTNTTTLYQDNRAEVGNHVDADAKTGDNTAVSNTGGSTMISTGKATVKADVSTAANMNSAQIGRQGGGLGSGAVNATIDGNGENSVNQIGLVLSNAKTIVQDNWADINNTVYAKAKTGSNVATGNTGGLVMISTGEAKADVTIDNLVNFNSAAVDCGCATDLGGSITGNGEDSHNGITAALSDGLQLFQGGNEKGGNWTELGNRVNADPSTGLNAAVSNTGVPGDPVIVMTGGSNSGVGVSNTANENVFGSSLLPTIPGMDFTFDASFFWFWFHHSV